MQKIDENRSKKPKTGGRKKGVPNKANRELKEIADDYSAEAIEVLADVMRNSDSDKARASAANMLLDRAHGKPAQTQILAGDKNNPLELLLGFRDSFRSKLVRFAQPRAT